jgi:hypothetical protein
MKQLWRSYYAFALTGVLFSLAATRASSQEIVVNKAYDLYVSPSFGTAPNTPFHDCIRFSATQVCLDACGDCGAFTELRLGLSFTQLAGSVSCGGLNLKIFGSSLDGNLIPGGLGADVFSALFFGSSEGTTFAAEGVANSMCTLDISSGRGLSGHYAKASAGK